jgi:outer membrane receptor protein involved in Fe transport
VDLDGRPQTWSLYGSDALAFGRLHFTASARFNRTSIRNRDQINPGGGPGSLDGDHIFQRLNPAAGVTYSPTETLNIYFSYSESSRAPTSIELGCADPSQPCKLPNAMAGDPPLDQVVARTWETGIRNGSRGPLTWNLGFFLADNYNDILFVTSEQSGFGYFKNFGRTKRQGIEVGMSGTVKKKVTLHGGYTFLDATYQSEETVNGSGNSTNDAGSGLEGVIEVAPGNRIPLTPRHMFKASLDYQPIRRIFFNLNLITASSSFARGNENNQHQPVAPYYLGPGTVAGYEVMNAGVRFDLHKHLELTAQFDNIFNKRYSTAAQLGATGFRDDATFIARPFPAVGGEFPVQQATFYSPGAPRSFIVGTRLRF